MSPENMPRQQNIKFKKYLEEGYDFYLYINRLLSASDIDPSNVFTAVELGCGVGVVTQALLKSLPNAQVHAVDYHPNTLDESLANNPKVTIHKGLFVDILASKVLPLGGIVLASNIFIHHGFTYSNYSLLTDLVDDGYLITIGDNDSIEKTDWFEHSFKVHHNHNALSRVWKKTT